MLKKKDIMIMSHLRQNARMSLTKLAKKTGMPVSTIFDRIKLNQHNLIDKHVALIDFSKLGYATRALVLIRTPKNDKDGIKEYLTRNENINSLYKINNGYDFMAECVFRNVKALQEFIDLLEERFKIKGTEVYYMIDDIKKEAFLSDPGTVELLFDL